MLTIQTKSSDITKDITVGYTVNSKLIPSANEMNLSSMYFNYVLTGTMANKTTNDTVNPNQYSMQIFQRPIAPFDNGSIVLYNSKKGTEIDILPYFATPSRTKSNQIVGVADMTYKSISTSGEVNGMLNVTESSTTFNDNYTKVNYKRVFDFPTNVANAEFDEILIMSSSFNRGISNEYPNVSDYSNGTGTKMYINKNVIVHSDGTSSYSPRFCVDDVGNMLLINPGGDSILCINGVQANVNYTNETESNLAYSNCAYINGKFVLVRGGIGSSQTNTVATTYYIFDTITYNEDSNEYDVTLTSGTLPKFGTNIVNGTYFIPVFFEWDGFVYMMVARHSTGSTYNSNILKLNLTMDTIIDNWSTTRTDILNVSGSQYYPVHVIYNPGTDTVILGRSNCNLIELHKDLSVDIHGYSMNTYQYSKLYRFPNNEKLYSALDPINPLVGVTLNKLTSYCEVKTMYDAIMRIRLDEPVQKSNTETLKIALDITLELE